MIVFVLMIMIYVLIRSQVSHKSAQVWTWAWPHAAMPQWTPLMGYVTQGDERQIKLRASPKCHRHSVFSLFSIQVNDELRFCWQSRQFFSFFFSIDFNITPSIRSEVSERFCQRSAHWSQMGKKKKKGGGVEMSRKSRLDEKVGGLGFPCHSASNMRTNHTHTQINSHKLKYWVETVTLAAGSKPTLTWCRPSPRVARRNPASSCQLSSSVKNLMCGAAPCQLLPLPLLLWWQSWCDIVTGAACKAAGAPHLNELSHQAPFIRNSAGLLFLLLTACVFILWMPGFSAHSWFSSTLMFS